MNASPGKFAMPPPSRAGVWQRLRRRRGTDFALCFLAITVFLTALAPLFPLPPPDSMDPSIQRTAPDVHWTSLDDKDWTRFSERHPIGASIRNALFGTNTLFGLLGTDTMGRDVFSRVVWGGRISLMVGLVATIVSVLIGVTWGALSGLAGGKVDQVMMRVVDVLYSVPLLFLVILVVALLRERSLQLRELGIDRVMILYIVIGAVSWLTMARVVRGQMLSLREKEFVMAARALGTRPMSILFQHLMPHLWGLVVIYLTLTIPRVILFEAFLSFLGLGVEAPGVSWGLLASEGLESLTAISVTWWLVLFPGLAMVLTLSALNTLGDALRDALDPRLGQSF